MTEYYSVPENQMFHALGLNDVRKGDIVVTSYAGDDNFYRAKVMFTGDRNSFYFLTFTCTIL